jgi:hypothetical protein
MYDKGYGRDGGKEERHAKTIPLVEWKDGKPAPFEHPMYGAAGTEELWRQVLDGLRERMRKLGWNESRLLLGTSGDTWPSAQTVAFFKKVAAAAHWRALTHGCGAPKWGPSDMARTQPNGMVLDLLEIARRIPNHRLQTAGCPVTCNSRDHVGSGPESFRSLPGITLFDANYEGWCWKGLDYWDYTTPAGTRRNALNTYVHFGNMVGSTPRAIAAPGPEGAVATAQFEMLKEGTQECEALLALRERLQILDPQPKRKCDAVELFLADAVVRENNNRSELSVPLYLDGGEVGVLSPAAPFYNTGRHSGQGTIKPSAEGECYSLHIRLNDDPWVKGGEGRYEVKVKRNGDNYTGSYTGAFKGQAVEGAVSGVFRAGGYELPLEPGRPKSELAVRCEALTAEYARILQVKGGPTSASLRPILEKIYSAAAEAEEKASAREGQNPRK